MPWYRCLIEGENFPGALIGKRKLVGFFTTRWVEASSPEEAETAALAALRAEPTFQVDEARRTPNAKLYFEEIVEVDGPEPNLGVSWFVMGT